MVLPVRVGLGQDFDLFGHRLTNSALTAVAINSAVGTLGSFIFALPGGWLGDKFGRLPVLLVTGYITCAFPLINAFIPTYTWVSPAVPELVAVRLLPWVWHLSDPPRPAHCCCRC